MTTSRTWRITQMNNLKRDTLARCKALALAAMIDAGGKPCWVAASLPAPPNASLCKLALKSTRYASASRRSPPAAAASAAAVHALADQPVAVLTPAELALLSHASPRLLAAMSRAFAHLPKAGINAKPFSFASDLLPAKRSRVCVAGGRGRGAASR